MYLSSVALVSPDPAGPQVSAEVVADIVWAHCQPADGLQHLRGRNADGEIRLTFFISATSQEHADTMTRQICERLVESVQELAQYTKVISVPADPFGPAS